jgi:hypothetical protein
MAKLVRGLPTRVPVNRTPPDIVNNANRRIINGIYSNKETWINSYRVIENPWKIIKGMIKTAAHNNEILPKL